MSRAKRSGEVSECTVRGSRAVQPWLQRRRRLVGAVTLLVLTCGLAACGSSDDDAGGGTASASADGLPDSIADSGVLRVAWIPYPPYSLPETDAAGRPDGLATDVGEAMAKELGVKLKFVRTAFASLIPGVQSGRFDIAMTGTYDTPERSAVVDIVDWIVDGEAPVFMKGNPNDVRRGSYCGKTIAAVAGTQFATVELPAESKKCEDEGRPPVKVLTFPSLNNAVAALKSGRADAFLEGAISATTRTNEAGSELEAGEPYNNQPIGILVKKGSPLTGAIQRALQKVVDDGAYDKALAKWGVEQYAIPCITVGTDESTCLSSK